MKKICIFLSVLVLVSCLAVPAFAETEYYSYNGTELPYFSEYESLKDEFPYLVLLKTEDGIHMYMLPSEVIAHSGGLYCRYGYTARIYVLSEDGATWDYLVNKSYSGGSSFAVYSNGISYIWSSCDIYSSDGTFCYEGDPNFYQPPLAEVVQAATVEGANRLVGTMKVLTLCGVGCLASLVVLEIFGKRSLISRH